LNDPKTKIINAPLNRVEGDLEIRVRLEDDRISEAWSVGVMFRGIENMLMPETAHQLRFVLRGGNPGLKFLGT